MDRKIIYSGLFLHSKFEVSYPLASYCFSQFSAKKNSHLTVINETTTITDKGKDIFKIESMKEARDCAIPLVINFMHEKSGHYKYILKNDYQKSPVIYFKGIKTELEKMSKNGIIDGESDRIIEHFICEDPDINNELSNNFIYGDLLESKHFNGDDNKLKK